jgi:hypothetical protein
MNSRLARALRLAKGLAAASKGGVILYAPGKTVEESVACAIVAGRHPPFVVVPAPVGPEQWEAEAVAQQIELQRRAEAFFRTGCVPEN